MSVFTCANTVQTLACLLILISSGARRGEHHIKEEANGKKHSYFPLHFHYTTQLFKEIKSLLSSKSYKHFAPDQWD